MSVTNPPQRRNWQRKQRVTLPAMLSKSALLIASLLLWQWAPSACSMKFCVLMHLCWLQPLCQQHSLKLRPHFKCLTEDSLFSQRSPPQSSWHHECKHLCDTLRCLSHLLEPGRTEDENKTQAANKHHKQLAVLAGSLAVSEVALSTWEIAQSLELFSEELSYRNNWNAKNHP